MDHARWEKIEALLQKALDLESKARGPFLEQACNGDETLQREINTLLAGESQADRLLESHLLSHFAREPGHKTPSAVAGQLIDHYRIEARIGAGGMGEVYRARDEKLQRTVAIKMLPSDLMADPNRVLRLEQEARAASGLNHPNIISIFEIAQHNGTTFIVSEYIEGNTLRQMLTDPGTGKLRPLATDESLRIALQVAGALKAAHTALIIHRDIKPENIMVRNDSLVKVLDFGIAKFTEEGARPSLDAEALHVAGIPLGREQTDLTVPGAIVGTASYMSPEQARGERLDTRTDIFSLGLVLYEMTAGRRLLEGNSPPLCEDDSTPSTLKLEQVPRALEPIISRALRLKREERYASAGEMIEALERVQLRRKTRTGRRMTAAGALALVVAAILAVVAAAFSVSETWEEKTLREGHTAAVHRVVFSPNGKRLVSGGEDNTVMVWDFDRRERVAVLTDHTDWVNALAFSPGGKWLATGSYDQTVIVWDASLLQKVAVLQAGRVGSLAFSPDGHFLASTSEQPEPRVFIWQVGSWQRIQEISVGCYFCTIIFSADGREVSLSSGAEGSITWDIATGTRRPGRFREGWGGLGAAVSRDGTRMVTVDPQGNVRFSDLVRRQLLAVHRGHQDHGRAAAFSPDGRLAATGAEHVVLWDATTQTKLVTLEHSAVVWGLAFSPDGRWLVSSHGDGAMMIWEVAERERRGNMSQHSGPVRAVAFSQDGKRVASSSEDRSVIIWDAEHGTKEAVLIGHETRVMGVVFSPDGKWVASTDQYGVTICWDIEQRQRRWTHRSDNQFGQEEQNMCLAVSPDGRWLANSNGVLDSANGNRVVHADYSEVWLIFGNWGIAFSPDGRWMAYENNGYIVVWSTETWRVVEHAPIQGPGMVSLTFSPDSRQLITADDGGLVRLWDTNPIREVAVIGRHNGRVKSVAVSPDGSLAASAGDDQTICLWNVKNRRLITRIGTHSAPVLSVAFSPDGRQLVSGEHDKSVRLYTRHRTIWGYRWD